jgi:AraC-like DNA-binding protein
VDSLSGFLDGPRARGAFLLRSILEPPWSLAIRDEAPLTIVCVVRGSAWVVPTGAAPTELRVGDVALVRGPEHYVVADRPDRRPQVIITPGQECIDLAGNRVAEAMSLGVRTWGNAVDGATMLLTGTYQGTGEISRRLLDALPPLIVLPATDGETEGETGSSSPVAGLLAEEIGRNAPGQEVVLDRLLDLLVVTALREWFDRPGAVAPAWYAAHADPMVGHAIRLLHNNPEQPWTVSSLAAAVGSSRAALARRFTDLVGEPPIAFLTTWRLALAADLLREPDATVARVARQVGYGSPFTFSAAFKRHYGLSPQEHRTARSA